MKKTILITSLLILLFSSSKAVDVVVRYDDYMLKPDTIQEKIVELFNKYNIPIVLGVIPCDEEESYVIVDGDYLSLLKELNNKGVVEIALHGLTHTLHNDGEFIGIPLAEQKRMLSKGKKILDSLFSQVVTFIPPWNKYDSNTLIALQQLGFKCISSCLTIGQPLENPYLQYYPHTVDNMTDFLKAIKDNKNRDCIIILMIHQYDFKEENSIHELDLLLSDLKQRSYVNFSTFKNLENTKTIVDKNRFNSNLEVNLLSKILHTELAIQTTSFSKLVRIANLFLYLFFILIAFIIYRNALKVKNKLFNVFMALMTLLISGIVWNHLLTPQKILFIEFGLLILIFVVIVFLRAFRNRVEK